MRAVIELGPVVKDAVGCAQSLAAPSVGIPGEAHARREVGPPSRDKALRHSRIAAERESGGSVDVDTADLARRERRRAEMVDAGELIAGRPVRLPATARMQMH